MAHYDPSKQENHTQHLLYIKQGAMVIENLMLGRVDPTYEVPIWAQELAIQCKAGQLPTS